MRNPMATRKTEKRPVPPSITDAEWKVMLAFWERGDLNLREVVEALAAGTDQASIGTFAQSKGQRIDED